MSQARLLGNITGGSDLRINDAFNKLKNRIDEFSSN